MIVCSDNLGRAESRPVDGSYCINGSVSSEAFFVGVDVVCQPIMDLIDCR